ncbi:hypothetical protein Taro_024159, partial [Colocasia esculenta]|nr:hypothetical protein [Colocasia esculenta]
LIATGTVVVICCPVYLSPSRPSHDPVATYLLELTSPSRLVQEPVMISLNPIATLTRAWDSEDNRSSTRCRLVSPLSHCLSLRWIRSHIVVSGVRSQLGQAAVLRVLCVSVAALSRPYTGAEARARLASRECGLRVPLLAASGGGLVAVVTRASGGSRSVSSRYCSSVLGCQSAVAPAYMASRPCGVSGVRGVPSVASDVCPTPLVFAGVVIGNPYWALFPRLTPLHPSARGLSLWELSVREVAEAAVLGMFGSVGGGVTPRGPLRGSERSGRYSGVWLPYKVRARAAGCSCCCATCMASVVARRVRAVAARLALDLLAVVFLVWRMLAGKCRCSAPGFLAEVRFPQNCVVLISGCCCATLEAEVHRLVALCSGVLLVWLERSGEFSQNGALVVLVEVLLGPACVASAVLLAIVFSLMATVVLPLWFEVCHLVGGCVLARFPQYDSWRFWGRCGALGRASGCCVGQFVSLVISKFLSCADGTFPVARMVCFVSRTLRALPDGGLGAHHCDLLVESSCIELFLVDLVAPLVLSFSGGTVGVSVALLCTSHFAWLARCSAALAEPEIPERRKLSHWGAVPNGSERYLVTLRSADCGFSKLESTTTHDVGSALYDSWKSEKAFDSLDSESEMMASSRVLEGSMLTPEQLQLISSAKYSICSGKVVDFTQLHGSLEGSVTGFVKGTKVNVSEDLLVQLLDCPNTGHKLSEIVPLDKQKIGIIGILGTISKKGLLVNGLYAEKRIMHSVITNIITPRAGTHSSITARDVSKKKKLEKIEWKLLIKTNNNSNNKKKSNRASRKNKNHFSKGKYMLHLLSIMHLKKP